MALNVYWEAQRFVLPELPEAYEWRCFADTALDGGEEENNRESVTEYLMHPRSAAVFVGSRRDIGASLQ